MREWQYHDYRKSEYNNRKGPIKAFRNYKINEDGDESVFNDEPERKEQVFKHE